ncbi:Ribosomal RNA small subunit methyltransferase E [Caldalkalibacillus thermarum TA2.A1]|uniref:Ribosomal RNA small subunit methyltransferase E n=1 Tax=Caldalkalibacillus thermarum (strain TA2.A1) TaxID=986075 RepID=F5L7N5_CALTT|nr:16S rRNA (uracil(1498)-N(3))-methyltransferase [Caldalkalibacillus thermarum]EGL82679.1 Ribosomal RNA small subunit methyltransferase E [Caldalkalibacillus thermarum TA2.A1]
MQRYFLPPDHFTPNQCVITGQDAYHIQRVMRMSLGERVICCDGRGRSVVAELTHFDTDVVHCHIVQELDEQRELPVQVTIAQGLPKGDKMEWVLQKGTELGAVRFVPFVSERTIVKYDQQKEKKKRQRWQKIIKEAAEQTHRQWLPELSPIVTIDELAQLEADTKLVADEEQSTKLSSSPSAFVQALKGLEEKQHLAVAIGPEGGFSREEIHFLKQHGFTPISLGRRILRTETASQYVLAAISFYFEQMGG